MKYVGFVNTVRPRPVCMRRAQGPCAAHACTCARSACMQQGHMLLHAHALHAPSTWTMPQSTGPGSALPSETCSSSRCVWHWRPAARAARLPPAARTASPAAHARAVGSAAAATKAHARVHRWSASRSPRSWMAWSKADPRCSLTCSSHHNNADGVHRAVLVHGRPRGRGVRVRDGPAEPGSARGRGGRRRQRRWRGALLRVTGAACLACHTRRATQRPRHGPLSGCAFVGVRTSGDYSTRNTMPHATQTPATPPNLPRPPTYTCTCAPAQAAAPAGAGKKLSMAEKSATLRQLIADGWLASAPTRPGYYCLGVGGTVTGWCALVRAPVCARAPRAPSCPSCLRTA